jgi:hypothetical protein
MFSVELGQSLDQMLEILPMKVQMPEALQMALEVERGVVDSTPYEARRTARFRCRGAAVVLLVESPIDFPDQDREAVAIVRDVSRTGLGLIAHQQYFPEQRLMIILENTVIEGKVARARKLGPSCFEIGSLNVAKKSGT